MTGPSGWLALLALGSAATTRAPEHFGAVAEVHADVRGAEAASFDAAGRLWIAETLLDRLTVIEADGTRRAIGGRCARAGEFLRPAGLACAADGRVYVADTGNRRVQVLDGRGAPLLAFGARGRGAGGLCEPRGLALDARRVLVADAGHARVACFTLEGEPLAALDADGALVRPTAVALDALGRVWIADEGLERVVRLDATGAIDRELGGRGRGTGRFAAPVALGFVGTRLFVADRHNHRVQEFDAAGAFVAAFPRPAYAPHGAPGGLFSPAGLAISPDGARIALCEPLEDRVQVFVEAADAAEVHDDHGEEGEHLARVSPGAAGDGRVTAWIEPEGPRVRVLRDEGPGLAPLTELGVRGGMACELARPLDVALDAARGRIHVADGGRLWTFALREGALERGLDPLAGRVERYVELEAQRAAAGIPLEWPASADALAVLPDGGLVAADARNRSLLVLDAGGRLRATWDLADGGGLSLPVELVRADEQLFVCDADRGLVLRLDLDGRCVARLEHAGEEPLVAPWGVLPLDDGRVLVSDRATDRIHVFDAQGVRVSTFGARGGGPGELRQPTALLPSTRGHLRVIDTGNRRAQVLTLDGHFVLSLG
jgi:DNA-binding beta-propeller fold protein YncE